MKNTFKAVICVSDLVATASEGEKLGSVVVPSGKIGLATICNVVINGVLLKADVPTEYRFGGLLEVRNLKPQRLKRSRLLICLNMSRLRPSGPSSTFSSSLIGSSSLCKP